MSIPSKTGRYPWLFGARIDLSVFLGSALLSFVLLGVGSFFGVLHTDSPQWIWVPAVLLIDIAHVWSTIFRVYLDADERKRRPWLYWGTPILVYGVGFILYSLGSMWFWTTAAYFAVYHFVRQQYGWVALYRHRGQESESVDRLLDTVTIYAVTIYPLLYWHANLPQEYWWFVANDFFVSIPRWVDTIFAPLYWFITGSYLVRAVYRWTVLGLKNPGKDIVVITTALCWYLGIVYLNSDYAFTVTNVIIHGVPYIALVYWFGRRRVTDGHGGGIRLLVSGPLVFILVLVCLAYGEELLWDRLIWHERAWLFGDGWTWGRGLESALVPLLAVPQLTHYFLDGFIWRGRSNPEYRKIQEG